MTGRADLLALSDDSLAALANRGLVKRALREVAEGRGPALVEDPDGTVTASWEDGTVASVARGATLEQAGCSCAAAGVCRHRLMLVVAYRAGTLGASGAGAAGGTPAEAVDGGAPVPPVEATVAPAPAEAPRAEPAERAWTPGDVTDAELEDHVGARVMATAQRTRRAGYTARVRRPGPDDPVPTVELASVTVRFLVPGELGYARADAARGARPDAVVLAVWAWRAAADADPDAAVVDVSVGTARSAGADEALETARDALADLLAVGVAHLDAGGDRALAVARRALDGRDLRWPVDVLDDLVAAVQDHRDRTSAYSPPAAAALVAELVARARCAGRGASPAAAVLGTEEAARTPLRLARLTGLGARLRGPEDRRTLEVYLAHPESGTVLVVRRVLAPDAEGSAPDLEAVRRTSAAGHRLSAVAVAEVVTESAVRAADRTVVLTASRVSRTTVAPSAGRWEALPPGLLLRDLDAAAAALAARPPAVVRPRVAAHDLHAVVVTGVEDLAWSPGAQALTARLTAPRGSLLLRARHTAAAPGAVDVLQEALSGRLGELRHVAGHLRRESAGLVLEPTAVVVGDRVLAPDLATPTATVPAPVTPTAVGDALRTAVSEALATSAALVHSGWQDAPPSWRQRASRAAESLRGVGLAASADALHALPAALDRAGARHVLDAWADVHLRLLVTAEQL